MAYENMPAGLQPIFQTNMLEKAFQNQLEAKMAFAGVGYRHPVPIRNGEMMIYSRAGRLAPVIQDVNATLNTNLDNGLTVRGNGAAPNTYPFEQWSVTIGQIDDGVDLNVIQNKQTIASVFLQNWENLGQQAALSLDLKAAQALFGAYESGRTYVRTTVTSATVSVDNITGFSTAFGVLSYPGAGNLPGGLPAATSVSNTLNVTWIVAATGVASTIVCQGFTADGANVSTAIGQGMTNGVSGTLTFSASQTFTQGDILIAADAPTLLRPNNKLSRFALTAQDSSAIQLVINAVAELQRNGVAPPSGADTYPALIDPVVDAAFFTDPQFQVMSQGAQGDMATPFKNARMARNFDVSFIRTTNCPVYSFTNSAGKAVFSRRLVIMGERALQKSPFEGTRAAVAEAADYGVADYRPAPDDMILVTRPPLDRLGQILAQSWYWIGGFAVPTDATITPIVIPSCSNARYKRAVEIEICTPY